MKKDHINLKLHFFNNCFNDDHCKHCEHLIIIIGIGSIQVQSNFSYLGTSLNRAADLPYFMLTLQKLWAIKWVWPIAAYLFILYSEIRTNLSYGHPDKRV